MHIHSEAGVVGEFSPPHSVNLLCWLLFSICSIQVVSQWNMKDPSHSAKIKNGRVHLTMHAPMTPQSQNGLYRLSVGIFWWNKLTHNLSANACSHSPQLTELLWIDPGLKSGTGQWCMRANHHHTKKREKSAGTEWFVESSPQSTLMWAQSHYHNTVHYIIHKQCANFQQSLTFNFRMTKGTEVESFYKPKDIFFSPVVFMISLSPPL